jgi:hypothetical protein
VHKGSQPPRARRCTKEGNFSHQVSAIKGAKVHEAQPASNVSGGLAPKRDFNSLVLIQVSYILRVELQPPHIRIAK